MNFDHAHTASAPSITMDIPISAKASVYSLGTGYFELNSVITTVVFKRRSRESPDQIWGGKTTLSCTITNCCNESSHEALTGAVSNVDIKHLPPSSRTESALASTCHDTPEISSWSDESLNSTVERWDLSNGDRLKLIDLGRRLADMSNHRKNNPSDVVRFFIANSGDINNAEKQFRKMVEWRKQYDVDRILENYRPPKDLVHYYPGAVLNGLDYDGDPIFVSRLGVTDAAGMLKRYGHEEMIKHAIWLRELLCTGQWMQEYEAVHNKAVKRAIVIEDVHNIQLLKIASNRPLLSLYADVMRLDQDNYPEAAKKIFIIRAPALFSIIWNIAQHFFDVNVREKMVFTSRSNYMDVLSQYMDLSVLPSSVVPGIGKGTSLQGMPPNFEGGPLPLC